MLQINVQPYASDALEDAMRLAQTKALNSYTFSDMLNYLNYAWMDIYQKCAEQDDGFYSRTVRITTQLTKLPPYVKNSIKIYSAQRPVGFNRDIFRASGYNDLQGDSTYHISGFDLYCPSATRRTVWMNYIPMQAQLFFTKDNRDPKLFEPNEHALIRKDDFNLYKLHCYRMDGMPVNITDPLEPLNLVTRLELIHKDAAAGVTVDISQTVFFKDNHWKLQYISCDFPYIFVSYKHELTDEYYSGFFNSILNSSEFVEYNAFAFTGRNTNVEYVDCKWNDKTGMGVVVIDHNDKMRYKELGWTPDTLLIYPAPEMYRLLVARLADKFSKLNESNVMGVQAELTEATYAFVSYLKKDKSAWQRIDNVNGPNIGDML